MVVAERTETRATDSIVWRKDLYPRFEPDPATIQRYAESIEYLPPIEVNQHNELIDGYHRWTAHKKAQLAEVPVTVTVTESDAQLLRLAIERNATHGLQLSLEDKRRMAQKLYGAGAADKDDLARILAVSRRAVAGWVESIDSTRREERKRTIFDMWMRCHTQEEIADAVGTDQSVIARESKELCNLEKLPKSIKLAAEYQDADWSPQLYDIWNFAKNSNSTKHYGNTAVEIVDNLLYTFTKPFDVVVDPFGGGGSTIDVCKRRLRRYWVSDRKPVPERPDIREHDIVSDRVSGPSRWKGVKLVYLDPPYWKQAAGKYSNDPTDLANMLLEEFTDHMVGLIHTYAANMEVGSHIACIISPTQWPNEDKSVNYHDIDLACRVGKNLRLVRRALCPYSSEQYNGTQVEIAKGRKLWLVLSRTLLVWERV